MLSPVTHPLETAPQSFGTPLSPPERPPENEHAGSAAPGGPAPAVEAAPRLSNAELVQLQIRVIALENLVVALLAHAPERQLELVRDIAASIFPRPGVEHRLTSQAASQMEHLAQRSRRLQGCLAPTPQGEVEADPSKYIA